MKNSRTTSRIRVIFISLFFRTKQKHFLSFWSVFQRCCESWVDGEKEEPVKHQICRKFAITFPSENRSAVWIRSHDVLELSPNNKMLTCKSCAFRYELAFFVCKLERRLIRETSLVSLMGNGFRNVRSAHFLIRVPQCTRNSAKWTRRRKRN